MSYYLLDHHVNRNRQPGPASDPDTRPWYETRRVCQHGISGPHLIVIHTPQTTPDFELPYTEAERIAAYGSTITRASWHDTTDGDSIIPMLPPEFTAWHVRGFNRCAVGIEIGARHDTWPVAPDEWVAGVLTNAAARAGEHSRRFGIPAIHRTRAEVDQGAWGFVGHAPLDPTRRSDPGKTFPWDRYLSLVSIRPGGDDVDQTTARLEVARIWGKALGTWPQGTPSETAQQRLTRIANELIDGETTTEGLFKSLERYAPHDVGQRRAKFFAQKAIPAWVLVEGVPSDTDGDLTVDAELQLPASAEATIRFK